MGDLKKEAPEGAYTHEFDYTKKYNSTQCPQLRVSGIGHPDERYSLEANEWADLHREEYWRLGTACLSEAREGKKISLRQVRLRHGIYYNNNLDAPMTERLEADYPALVGMFRTRNSKARGWA